MDREPGTRVSRTHPCPICGRSDWCLLLGNPESPTAAICPRTRSAKRAGNAGFLHILRRDEWRKRRLWSYTFRCPPKQIDNKFAEWAAAFCANIQPGRVARLAEQLSVSAGSLIALGVGWASKKQAWSFPMHDGAGHVIGIALRKPDGFKFAINTSRMGIFVASEISHDGALVICEGATDTAALLDLGYAAIGRPGCDQAEQHLVDFVQARGCRQVVIVADRDPHGAGQRGAQKLAARLALYVNVRLIFPPAGVKDARQWKRNGARHEDLAAVIAAAEPWKVEIK